MASLKDLRNRIASVKATQKITKAMQMVAAAKLRRAQEAAEAARPYSQRMGAVLANITAGGRRRRRCAGADDRHRQGRRASARRLHRRARPVRRLQQRRSRVLRATMSAGCWRQGKTVKIICVGKKGYDILRRDFATLIIDRVDLREVKQLGFVNADAIARKVIQLFNEGEFDVCTLFYSEFKSVITQMPTALQIIPAAAPVAAGEPDDGGGSAVYEYEPEPGEILVRPHPAQHRGAGLPRAARKRGRRDGRQDERDGQRDAQRRRHDQQADDHLQPPAPGADHQGTDRNHFGRGSALGATADTGVQRDTGREG